MASVAQISIEQPGPEALRILAALREAAEPYSVGIEQGESGTLMVKDQGDRTSGDLPSFLRDQLEAINSDWQRYIRIL